MKCLKVNLFFAAVLLTLNSKAQPISEAEIVDKYIPAEMLAAKNLNTDPPEKITRLEITKIFKTAKFNNSDAEFIVTIYSTIDLPGIDVRTATLSVIKVEKNGSTSILATPTSYKNISINDRSRITLFDLDKSGEPEVIISNFKPDGEPYKSFILKWSGTNLENITPFETNGVTSKLNKLNIDALPVLVYEEYLSNGNEDPLVSQIVLRLTSNGFETFGTYDFIKIITKNAPKTRGQNFEVSSLSPGFYTLEVKNLSNHSSAIRAEISLNGRVVMKPVEFCEKSLTSKGENFSNSGDNNEDGLRRCVPKAEIYSDVKVAKKNYFKVVLYGETSSKIQVTLKKKN